MRIKELELLNLVLSFAPRAEAKLSFLFSINLALLGFALLNLTQGTAVTWYVVAPFIGFIWLISSSFQKLYQAYSPNLDGGQNSVVYFSEIAKKQKEAYIADFKSRDDGVFSEDILEQVWTNSKIISQKFQLIKSAFYMTLLSLPFLVAFVIGTVITSGQMFKV